MLPVRRGRVLALADRGSAHHTEQKMWIRDLCPPIS